MRMWLVSADLMCGWKVVGVVEWWVYEGVVGDFLPLWWW